jgi:hypothetical protein
MTYVPCVMVIADPALWPEILLIMLASAVAVPVGIVWAFGWSIKRIAVSAWHRLEAQERARVVSFERTSLSTSAEIAGFLTEARRRRGPRGASRHEDLAGLMARRRLAEILQP